MFPDDADVAKVRDGIFHPFEYLMPRHRAGKLRTDFTTSLGKVAYHVACHQRVQNIGLKTKEVLQLVPDTQVIAIERCSGHDGTYAVKKEYYPTAMKLVRPVAKRVADADVDYYTSDCAMAARHIEHSLGTARGPSHRSRCWPSVSITGTTVIEWIRCRNICAPPWPST